MEKIIRENKEQGIVQITLPSERFYARPVTNKKTGLPEFEFVPSVTWIVQSFPRSIELIKWIASKGFDEAELLKREASERGSKVHLAIVDLIDGKEVSMNSVYNGEELTVEEWEALISFEKWFRETKPKTKKREIIVWNDEYNYAGSVDYICEIDGEDWIIDFKTSQSVWPSHELQINAYRKCFKEPMKMAILQVGYRRNKNGYKFTEITENFPLFEATLSIWQNEHGGEKPSQKDFPLTLSLKVAEKPN